MVITSKDNNRVKAVRKLHKKKERDKNRQYLIEGEHLVEVALSSEAEIDEIFILDGITFDLDFKNITVTTVNESVMKSLSTLVTPPGILAVVNEANMNVDSNRVLILDGIQDPGNLGTLIRTADAFNFKHIVMSNDTVDAYNDKVLRSAQGSHFHVKLERTDLKHFLQSFEGKVLTTSLAGEETSKSVKEEKLALILGNEGKGVSEEIQQEANTLVRITMPGHAESLNVAVAGGILMHEFKV